MAVNKVEYFGKVLLDLTGDTVTAETLAEGVTAHDKSGAKITGTMTGGGSGGGGAVETCTVEFDDGSLTIDCVYEIFENGNVSASVRRIAEFASNGAISFTDDRVVKGTQMVLVTTDSVEIEITGAATLLHDGSGSGGWIDEQIYVIRINGDCSIFVG